MNDGAFERAVDGIADGLAHEHRAHGDQTAGERLGENYHVGLDVKVMGGEKRAAAVHAGLHFVQHEESAVAPAEFLRGEKIGWVGNAHAAFGLHRLHDEGSELVGGEMLVELIEIAECDALSSAQHGAEAVTPERIAHQGECAAGEPMESAIGEKQAGAVGMGARELDRGLHAFTAGIGEVYALEPATGELDQPLRELGGAMWNVALQHGGAGALQLILDGGDDGGMVVTGVVHAVAGEEIENAASIGGEEFRGGTAFVLHVHLQNVEQFYPLRVDVVGIESVKRRNCGSH